jgi:hypothetical protein
VLSTFYAAFSPVCFTVLGLWLVVVQTRHGDWSGSAEHRRRAYAVSLHFALPGLMSLLSLVDPNSKTMWQVSFTVIAVLGIVALIALRTAASSGVNLAAEISHWVAVALYAVIGLVAVRPGILSDLGIDLAPLRVEAIALSLLLFLGLNVAWLLMFDTPDSPRHGAPS